MKPDRYAYPALFYFDEDGISIEFPDLPGCLPCAHSVEEAFANAREALGLHLYGMEEDHDVIPAPSPVNSLHPEEGGVVAMVDVFMPSIRSRAKSRVVKKTLTIPAWLNAAAEEAHAPYSKILQEGLERYLGLTTRPSE